MIKPVWIIVLLILFVVCSSMTQCPSCIKGNLKIDGDIKKWLPYTNKDSVSFISSIGTTTKYRVLFGDTTKEYKNFDCDDYYYADSTGASLEIVPADSLFISCAISSPSWLCFRVIKRDTAYLAGCDVLNGPQTEMRKKFSTLQLNNVLYNDVRLVNGYPGTNPVFDSIYFVKGYGIVSFKFNGLRYFLK
jgi:hypothetical protein